VTQQLTRGLTLATMTACLWGCGSFPLPKVYVLGDPTPPTPGVSSQAGLPVIELKTVSVPDYLDTTDILRRVGANQVVASPTGRWDERVSVGVTQALVSDLSKRLPGVIVETRSAYEPARHVIVDIERFDIAPDGRCTLAARWRITVTGGTAPALSEQGTFIEEAGSGKDAAAASAMTLAIDHLADHVAATVRTAMTAPSA
jgi:hypothetical protein